MREEDTLRRLRSGRPKRRVRRWLALTAALAALAQPAAASDGSAQEAPPPLTFAGGSPDIASTSGSGSFGHWLVDDFGLPAYDYTADQQADPAAHQPELAGKTEAWSQIGNDHIVANAYNDGYVQLWSEDRLYQWMNYYDPSADHFAGGYGYIDVDGLGAKNPGAKNTVISTLYDDRPKGSSTERVFGVGYYAKQLSVPGLEEADTVYAPFGDDPVLLHDVTITDTGQRALSGSYFEYWDVNPEVQLVTQIARGYTAPVYDPATRSLSVTELPLLDDTNPLTIFAAALSGPVSSYDADTTAFFGSGGQADPTAVTAGQLGDALAPANLLPGLVGQAMFAFQAPFHLAPGQSVTLRYAYGYGQGAQVSTLIDKYRAEPDALSQSEGAWRGWLPKASFGSGYTWLSRELEWDAYMVRSDATYDALCGYDILSQGGYYQYSLGANIAFRDPLQIMLPMIWSDPWLAQQVIEYSAHEQPELIGAIPYGITSGCLRLDLGTSDDLDQYLMWSTAEYVLATRDFSFLNTVVPYYLDLGSGTILQHLELAYYHQEDVVGRGPHGEYLTGITGDWSDFSTELDQMTESDLVTAQAAYIYPLLAEAVGEAGDASFAAALRQTGARDLAIVKGQFVKGPIGGWFARGYSLLSQLGAGEIFEEPQPWALLAGAATPQQAADVVAAYRRFLVGIGAPSSLHGPSKIGAALCPASADPDVSERTEPALSNSACYPGGSWYDPNGWMVWALADEQGIVPGAVQDAWNELLRNTLHAHASAFPNSWDGIISVDDECADYYSTTPDTCGTGLSSSYDTQIPNQPAYSLFDLVQLAGVDPTATGYEVTPHLPMQDFDIRLPLIGVAQSRGEIRGYLQPVQGGDVVMSVAPPPGVEASHAEAWAGGHPTPHRVVNGLVQFVLPTRAGTPADWAVSGSTS